MIDLNPKRITVIVGHYGSGKTEVALSFARYLKSKASNVSIADLDTVNPYFRTKDGEEKMKAFGINVIAPNFANSNLDIPSLPPEVFSAFAKKDTHFVLDIGGDDEGATVLGLFNNHFKNEDYDMFCVINKCRYLTDTPEKTVEYIKDIEASSRLKITGLINNTNLAYETTLDTVLDSLDYASEVQKLSGKKLVFTSGLKKFENEVSLKEKKYLPLEIIIKHSWL